MRDALRFMSQSLDNPEGGMDGIVQVLACDVSKPTQSRTPTQSRPSLLDFQFYVLMYTALVLYAVLREPY